MARPSMFSRDYEKRMKRRRTNIILTILILISAAYFGGKYYLNKNNIVLFKSRKTAEDTKKKVEDTKPQENKKEAPNNTQTTTPPVENKVQSFEYKTLDGKLYKIEYSLNGQVKEINSLKEESGTVKYDISGDKKSIVFEDKSSGDIILGNVDGSFKKISRESYKVVSTGKTLSKEKVLKLHPDFIWSANPKFTKDGRVVYISDLPYIRKDNKLYIWTVDLGGKTNKRVGEIKGDMSNITFEGFNEDGSLNIDISGSKYVLKSGSFKLQRK